MTAHYPATTRSHGRSEIASTPLCRTQPTRARSPPSRTACPCWFPSTPSRTVAPYSAGRGTGQPKAGEATAPRTFIPVTNAIESVNARIRRAVRARGHRTNDQAALKCVYLAIMSLDPTGAGQKRWVTRWKAALNAFDITFEGRLTAGRK